MSGMRQRGSEYDLERDRYRERRRSRSRASDKYSRRRHSRSSSRGRSSSRHYCSLGRDHRNLRYKPRVSRSRSRSHTMRYSGSHSPQYSRRRERSHSSNDSFSSHRSHSSERKAQLQRTRYSSDKNRHSYALPELTGVEIAKVEQDDTIEHLPLPQKKECVGAYYDLDTDEPVDKEKIHREMEEKLRATLAKEGKVYPPPRLEASHPVFANDGSFIEIFKKMQQQAQQRPPSGGASKTAKSVVEAASTSAAAAYVAATSIGKPTPPPPIVGRRRGGKILKTGLVAKPKVQGEDGSDPKDFWSIYLREVNKYKNNACDSDGGTRPLVK